MKLKKIICVFLACVAVLGSLAACRADDATEKPIVQEQIEESNVLFVENGTSDYQIVLSQNATETEKYAAEELNYFLSLSSTCRRVFYSCSSPSHSELLKRSK